MSEEIYITQDGKKVSNDKLKITEININDNHVEICLEHWDFKWINHLCTTFSDEITYAFGYSNWELYVKEFRDKWEDKYSIFELVIPESFFKKHNLDDHCFHRIDKYNTDLIFKKNENR